MEEVRLEDYEGRERRTTRFFHEDRQEEDMPGLIKAGAGIAAAAGLLTLGHRTGAMRRVAKFLDTEVAASTQAFRETMDTQGSLFKGQDKMTVSRFKKLKDDFLERRRENLSNQKSAPKQILQSREFRLQKELRRRERMAGSVKSFSDYEGDIPHMVIEGMRHRAIFDDLKKNSGLNEDTVRSLEDTINQAYQGRKLGMLNRMSKNELEKVVKEYGKGIDQDPEVLKKLHEVREKYQGQGFAIVGKEAEAEARLMSKKFRQASALHMQEATKKQGKVKSFIIGHEQATVEDIMKMHKSGMVHLDKPTEAQINDVLKYNKDFGKAVWDENLYITKKDGEISGLMDYKSFSDIKRSQANWWANTIPGGLLRLRDILNVKEARETAGMHIFQRGAVVSTLNGHRGHKADAPLTEEVVFMYGKFVKLHDKEALDDDVALKILNPDRDTYLTSSQYGTTAKMHRAMSGKMTDNEKERNLAFEVLDLGRQDKDSVFNQGLSVFTKFFNKDWERNRVKAAIHNGFDDEEDMRQMNTYLKLNSKGYSPRVWNQLKDHLPKRTSGLNVEEIINEEGFSFSDDDSMLKLFKAIGKAESEGKGKNSPHPALVNLYKNFERDPDQVLSRKTPIGESNPIIGHHTRIRTGMDEINQQVSLYLTSEMLMRRDSSKSLSQLLNGFRTEIKGLHIDGKILKDDLIEAENLINYSIFSNTALNVGNNTAGAVQRTGDLFRLDKDFQDSMRTMARRVNPMWERHSNIKPVNEINDDYIAVNESNVFGIANQMFGLNSSMSERWAGTKDILKQLNPRTGRDNMQDVTTLSLYGTYFPMYRLQDSLGNNGLGFSDASMGNAFQMFNALMLKRIFPVYGAVEGYKYADYKMDDWTGEGLDERWENYKANSRLDDAATRTEFDIYEAKRQRMMRPGIEHWEAMPEIHIPGIGPVGAGDILNNVASVFFGKAPLREEELMSYNETLHDLYEGEDEVRKSRWWLAGSKSAYRGDRVIEHAPNSFRKAHSDWEYSGTGATAEEYWGNHLLPTLENPLGGLAFAVGARDPYWFEKKHYYDRPYMLTGELFNPNTMVLGDIGNATIGRLVKPVEKMHPEYWGDPNVIYEEETSKLGERPDSPVYTEVSPAGRVEHSVKATPGDYGAPIRYIASKELYDNGEETGAYVLQDNETEEAIYVPANVAKDKIPMDKMFAMARAESPEGSYMQSVTPLVYNPSMQRQVSTQPRAMFDEEFAYRNEVAKRRREDPIDPRESNWRLQEAGQNWSEPLGVYKWIIGDEIAGSDPYAGKTVVQRADAANNASSRFWESELGSLGGQMSEIGRRFVRRDSAQVQDYNPIRNTMPEWMPGDGYFINFQTGDPYEKIPNGEYRLPGLAYESLNELHSDQTGRYGAFDKFKILADVAPFSDEYNFWSQYLLDTQEDTDPLRKEATEIRKQVSARRTKYEFEPYRFKGNDIEKMEVTVTKFLDDYTFLTEEMGDTPIRMAGMQYRKKAEGILQQYFQVGEKVTIGVNGDESKRISQDTYGTMRAVVFNEIGNINKRIIERGEMVEAHNDFSAAGVHARFSESEIRKGSAWEKFAHMSTPLHTKFLQTRTALEEYERDQIYGKQWATWSNFMVDDYILPTLQGLGRFDNPLLSVAAGGTTGLVLGRFFLQGGKPTKIAGIVGALGGLASNIGFKSYEHKHGEAWIPERRRVEHEVNEYFDILKYIKYEGLYQKAREEIAHQTGYDIEDFARVIEDDESITKEKRKELEEEKKRLFIDQPDGWEARRTEINSELEQIAANKNNLYMPESFLQALKYKEERDTTLYAIDPYDDRMKVMQAFPYKDKWFFQDFLEAPEEDREKILSLIPENQRRVYKALWGMGLEEQKPLEHYMQKYDIPDWNWEGWRPEYNLDDIKVKVVEQEGLDMSDFNYWDDDLEAAKFTPDLQGKGDNEFRAEAPSSFKGYNSLKENLVSILQGQGLRDVQVVVTPNMGEESQVTFDYIEDRSREIQENLQRNGKSYV